MGSSFSRDSRSTSRSRPTARARSDPTPSSCFTPQTSPSCSSRPLSPTSTLCRRCSGPSSLETLLPPFSDVGRPLRAAAARPTLPVDLSTTSLARTRSPPLSPTRSTQLSTLPLSSERVPLSRRPGFPSPTRPPTTLPSSSASSACRCPVTVPARSSATSTCTSPSPPPLVVSASVPSPSSPTSSVPERVSSLPSQTSLATTRPSRRILLAAPSGVLSCKRRSTTFPPSQPFFTTTLSLSLPLPLALSCSLRALP